MGVIAIVAIFTANMARADGRIVLHRAPGTTCIRCAIKTGVWAILPPRFAELKGQARPAVPGLEKLRCYDTEYGWIFAGDSGQARKLAEDVRAAAATFQRCFGKLPGRGAIVIIGDSQSLAVDGLRKAGAEWLMPWMDESGLAAKFDANSIRAQIRQQMGSFATEERVDQVMKQIHSQMQSGGSMGGGSMGGGSMGGGSIGGGSMGSGPMGGPMSASPMGGMPAQMRPVRHELGHLWFVRYVYGIDPMQAARAHFSPHYGGPAPDWLDETAAILMEDDAMTAMRRRHFQSLLQRSDQHDAIIPLTKLFTMAHPSTGVTEQRASGKVPHATDGQMHVTMRIVTGSGMDQAKMMQNAYFYEQCRSLIDFLSARTHNPHLWLEIAEADKRHLSTAAWLAQNGPRYGLPGSVPELEKQWLAWAKQQTGAMSAIPPVSMLVRPLDGLQASASPAVLFAANRFTEARDAYRQALAKSPGDVTLRNGLIRTLLRLDDWHDAVAQGSKAVQIAPENPDAHGLYALTLLRAGQPATATREAVRALQNDPNNYWGLVATGRLQLWDQQQAEAFATLQHAANLRPGEPEAWLTLAGCCESEPSPGQRNPIDAYIALHPHGHPHDMEMEELPGMRHMLDRFGAETPFHAATPGMDARLQAADAGETPPLSYTAPFVIRQGAIVVPAALQGQKFDLLFDTGGGVGILLGKRAAAKLRLPSIGVAVVRGAGGKEMARQYRADTLTLGDLNLSGIPIHAVNSDLDVFDGVFGVRSLQRYVVTVDFAADALTLARGKAAHAPAPLPDSRVVQLPFHDLGGNIIVLVTIEGRPTWAMVDTGAGMEMLMSLELARKIAAGRAKGSWREGVMPGRGGVGTTIATQQVLAFRDPISVGIGGEQNHPTRILPVTMAVGTEVLDRQLSPAYDFQVGGILGISLLTQTRRMTFDYPHHLLTLEYAPE